MNRFGGGLLAGMITFVGLTAPAGASTFEPTRFDDPRPGRCKPSDCSLREAISAANEQRGKDKISLEEGTYFISRAENAADDNNGGDFDLKGTLRIKGSGAGLSIVDGGGVSGVFALIGDAPKTIEKLTVTHGAAPAGAGIFVSAAKAAAPAEAHRLKRLIIQANDAGTSGGGIQTSSHPLFLSKTTVRGNSASLGGGIYQAAASTLGGPTEPFEIHDSTISSNTAEIGGGLYADGANPGDLTNDPRVEIINSTIAGNSATVSGGGMAAILGGDIDAQHVTVANNAADTDNSGGGSGGGVYQSTGSFTFNLEESLVKDNAVGTTGAGPQCAGEFVFEGVITPQGGSSCTFLAGSAISSETPSRIGPLADNGGPTETIEILSDSAANGWSDECPPKDQRGVARPTEDCDAGAYERP